MSHVRKHSTADEKNMIRTIHASYFSESCKESKRSVNRISTQLSVRIFLDNEMFWSFKRSSVTARYREEYTAVSLPSEIFTTENVTIMNSAWKKYVR